MKIPAGLPSGTVMVERLADGFCLYRLPHGMMVKQIPDDDHESRLAVWKRAHRNLERVAGRPIPPSDFLHRLQRIAYSARTRRAIVRSFGRTRRRQQSARQQAASRRGPPAGGDDPDPPPPPDAAPPTWRDAA